jgi:hypothetical protein
MTLRPSAERNVVGGAVAAAIVGFSWVLVQPVVEVYYATESSLFQPAWFSCCEVAAQLSAPRSMASSLLASSLLALVTSTVRPRLAALAGGGAIGAALVTLILLNGDPARQAPSWGTVLHVWLLWLVAPVGIVALVELRRRQVAG